MATFLDVLGVAEDQIGHLAGSYVPITAMKNGRCVPSSVSLARQSHQEVHAHMQFRRNDMGCPILGDGSIDRTRHDVEIQLAQELADKISKQVSESTPWAADCIRRLQKGLVTEEQDLPVIAEAIDLHVEITYPGEKHLPVIDFNRDGHGELRLGRSTAHRR